MLWVWYRVGITDTIDNPLGWDLIAAKRLTETDLPIPAILRHVLAAAIMHDKADRAAIPPEGRDRQDAFLLACQRHGVDPVRLTGPIV